MIPGFASAERAWENMNPFDSDCTCEAEGFICSDCGETFDKERFTCTPAVDCSGPVRPMTTEELAEHFPSQTCPQHGWCTGCASRNCEDCNG